MIIVRTPVRVEFLGGGTDIKYFYDKYPGKVLNAAIDRYVYISLNCPFDRKLKVRYSKNEVVDLPSQIKNTRVKVLLEYFKCFNKGDSLEITSTADIPSRGTGLGSSSSFSVGLSHALAHFMKIKMNERDLAKLACHVEIDLLKEPIGQQDQYAAAFGGLNLMTFKKNGNVDVSKVELTQVTQKEFESHLLMIYTGLNRSASAILEEQKKDLNRKIPYLIKMAELAKQGEEALREGDFELFGRLLEEEWNTKKNIGPITNSRIEKMYAEAKSLGAWGGRISGAGGGGFMILMVPENKQKIIREHFGVVNTIRPKIVSHGSQILCDESTWR